MGGTILSFITTIESVEFIFSVVIGWDEGKYFTIKNVITVAIKTIKIGTAIEK